MAIIVNAKNPVNDLTRPQLDDIFSGEILNWKQVGGPDLPVTAYVRDRSSRSSRSFNDQVLGGDEPYAGAKVVAKSNEMLERVGQDPAASAS